MKRIFIPLLAAVLLCFSIAAAMAAGDGLVFDPAAVRVFAGESLQAVLNREGNAAEGELTYSSANEKIATVDEKGVVTGVAKGQTSITAAVATESKTYKAQLKVTVDVKVTELEIKTEKLPLYAPEDPKVAPLLREDGENLPVLLVPVKKTITLQAAALPKEAGNRKVSLQSGDSAVLQTKSGSVTGVQAGETVLTVTSESNPEVNVRYRVLVIQPVKKLAIESTAASVSAGGQISLTARVSPENASMTQVVWTSGDEKILTVDENGVVTGIHRGNGRVIAVAADGSGVRANISIKVTQDPEALSLSTAELTVNTGRNVPVKATMEPKNADNKKVIWSSSDESVAKVDKNGRITGVKPGECTVTCVSAAKDSIAATVAVHVQQPVKKVAFTEKSAFAYAGETTQLSWIVEPADATNSTVAFTSSNEKVLTVDENGLVTGRSSGSAYVNMVSTDGSNRKARIQIKVGQHVTGVRMVRRHAYIDRGETATAGATLEPKDASNNHMTWISSDESVVTARGNTNAKMRLKGVGYGDAVVTGITEDGGFQTSLQVTVGSFDRALSFREFSFDNKGIFWLRVRNDSNLTITRITATLEVYDAMDGDNSPLAVNTKDGSNKVEVVWNGTLYPGESTGKSNWKMVNYRVPKDGIYSTRGIVTLHSYQIENDWIKIIREHNRQWKEY